MVIGLRSTFRTRGGRVEAVCGHRALAVFAFNLGVEVGQVLIVAVLFPLLFLIRRLKLYRRVVLPVAAVGMILVSGVWVTERAFGVDIPMRELLPPAVQKVVP